MTKIWKRLALAAGTALLLSSCGASTAAQPHAEAEEVAKAPEVKKAGAQKAPAKRRVIENPGKKPVDFYPNPQVTDDWPLQQPGDEYHDFKGTLTLERLLPYRQTQSIGDVSMTIRDVKVFTYDPSNGLEDFHHYLTNQEQFPFLKFTVEVTNGGKRPVDLAPVEHIVMNDRLTKDWEMDMYLEELHGPLKPGETKKGSFGYVLDTPLDEQPNAIVIKTSELHDAAKQVIAPRAEFSIPVQ